MSNDLSQPIIIEYLHQTDMFGVGTLTILLQMSFNLIELHNNYVCKIPFNSNESLIDLNGSFPLFYASIYRIYAV